MKAPRFIIIGAGISGLSLGWFLREKFPIASIKVFEKNSRPGGWIQTLISGDFLFETGPRSCRSYGNGIATLQLIESLGLDSQWISASEASHKRYLYTNGKLQQLTIGIWSFLTSPLTRPILSGLLTEWNAPRSSHNEDESIYSFISRRLGKKVAENLMDPLTSGIYAGDIRNLSIQSCFPDIYKLERIHGSITKGMIQKLFRKKSNEVLSPFVLKAMKTPIFSLQNGMETIVKELSSKLKDELHLNTEVTSLKETPESIEVVADSNIYHADKVFIALPAESINRLIAPIIHLQLPSKTTSVAIVNMGWKHNVLTQSGFGYLIPSHEREDLLGVVWDSSTFPQQNRHPNETRLTAMLGGAHRPDIPHFSHEKIVEISLQAIKKHLKISTPPDLINIKIAMKAIPQYTVGHANNIQEIESLLSKASNSRIELVGSSLHGVSVNDCIANARRLVL